MGEGNISLLKVGCDLGAQAPGIDGMKALIEKAARVCYASENKDSNDVESADKMIKQLKLSNHMTPLEHGTVYLLTTDKNIATKYKKNEYSRVKSKKFHKVDKEHYEVGSGWYEYDVTEYYITTNYRVLVENNWEDDLKYFCEPTDMHDKRISVMFISDIGVSREFNRHRKNSINEQSTRYCNYSKDKFGKEIKVIEPNWMYNNDEVEYKANVEDIYSYCRYIVDGNACKFNEVDYWLFANFASSFSYMHLINDCGWKAQQARVVLPLGTATILIHTAYEDDWYYFLGLRSKGMTGAPHPMAKEIADELMKKMLSAGYFKSM